MKKVISLLLSIMMLLSITAGLDFSAYALDSSGSCGDNVTYRFDSSTGTVTISGMGKMTDYDYNQSPFYAQRGITKIVIGSGVTSIGVASFWECSAVKSVTIPSSVKSINTSAFYKCSELTSITIPEGVSTISSFAFSNCSKLNSVTIPQSITKIDDSAFSSCSGLTSVNIKNIKKWCEITFASSLSNPLYYAKNLYLNSTLVTDLTIPEGITSINDYAFFGASCLKSVLIPSTVTSVGSGAFRNCKGLARVDIPVAVSNINNNAFYNCSAITDVYYGGTSELWKCITIGTSNENLTNAIIHYSSYPDTKNYEYYILPDGTAEVTKYKGEDTEPTIPVAFGKYTVTSIGDSAFNNCSDIVSVTIPENVINIGNYAFNQCVNLENVYYNSCSENKWNAILIGSDNDCLTSATLSFLEHSPASAVEENRISPTCTAVGSVENVIYCSVCHTEISRIKMTIQMLEHTPITDVAVAPTCTATGLTEGSHCSVCGAVLTAQDVINAKGHSYESVVTAPTCKDQGYTTYTCKDCGDSYKADFTAVTNNHDYKGAITTPATCNADGVKTFTCSICGDKYTEVIEKTGEHNYESVVTKPSTCTERGVNTFTCSVCGDKYISYISMKSHSAVVDAAVAPTCTKTGLTKGSHCRDCGAVITAQEVVNAKGHSYTSVVTAPTCRDKGYTTYTCTTCNDSYRADYTDKLTTHDYSSAVTKLPTCAAEGVKTFTCSVCGDKYTEPIDKLAHTPAAAVKENEKAATCTAKGSYDSVVYCSECKAELSREEKEIDIVDHTPATDKAVAPTCTVDGKTEGSHCAICEKVLVPQETVKATGHKEVLDSAYPATFTETGKTQGSHCSVCNTVIVKQKDIAKLGSPSLSKVKAAKKSFTAQWSWANGVDGYQIQYSLKKNFKKAKTKYSKSTKLTVKKLKSKKTYYVRVRAYKKINGRNYYSAWSTKKVKVK